MLSKTTSKKLVMWEAFLYGRMNVESQLPQKQTPEQMKEIMMQFVKEDNDGNN